MSTYSRPHFIHELEFSAEKIHESEFFAVDRRPTTLSSRRRRRRTNDDENFPAQGPRDDQAPKAQIGNGYYTRKINRLSSHVSFTMRNGSFPGENDSETMRRLSTNSWRSNGTFLRFGISNAGFGIANFSKLPKPSPRPQFHHSPAKQGPPIDSTPDDSRFRTPDSIF